LRRNSDWFGREMQQLSDDLVGQVLLAAESSNRSGGIPHGRCRARMGWVETTRTARLPERAFKCELILAGRRAALSSAHADTARWAGPPVASIKSIGLAKRSQDAGNGW